VIIIGRDEACEEVLIKIVAQTYDMGVVKLPADLRHYMSTGPKTDQELLVGCVQPWKPKYISVEVWSRSQRRIINIR
jgi:hypothetical protein